MLNMSGKLKPCETNPANQFLIHACRQTDRYSDRRSHIYPPPDKRYSPIISMTCEPNK